MGIKWFFSANNSYQLYLVKVSFPAGRRFPWQPLIWSFLLLLLSLSISRRVSFWILNLYLFTVHFNTSSNTHAGQGHFLCPILSLSHPRPKCTPLGAWRGRRSPSFLYTVLLILHSCPMQSMLYREIISCTSVTLSLPALPWAHTTKPTSLHMCFSGICYEKASVRCLLQPR